MRLPSLSLEGFNPRVREGRDSCTPHTTDGAGGFNPRVREGRDNLNLYRNAHYIVFQSTRP